MLLRDFLTEAPIGDWKIDQDFQSNLDTARSKWTGTSSSEVDHWSPQEQVLLTKAGAEVQEKVRNAFKNSKSVFNLYFWSSTNPNYDHTLEKGEVDNQWMDRVLGERAANEVRSMVSPKAITVVMTNNLSDEHKISINSPWMVAHRIAHALHMLTERDLFMQAVFKLCVTLFGYQHPDAVIDDYFLHDARSTDVFEIMGPHIAYMIGTMRSARERKLVSTYEFPRECFAQYLLTGDIVFKLDLDKAPEAETVTTDPKRIAKAHKIVNELREDLMQSFDITLARAQGKVFVM